MKLVLITRKTCIYCDKAKELITKKGDDYVEYDIDDKPDFKEFLKANKLFTVPQIYFEGHHVGGYDDLQEFYS